MSDRFTLLRGWTLAFGIFLAPLIFSFSLSSFLDAKESVFGLTLLFTTLLRIGGSARQPRPAQRKSPLLPCWLWLLLALLCVLCDWGGRVPLYAVQEGLRLALILALLSLNLDLLDHPRWRLRIACAVVASSLAVAGLALLQYQGHLQAILPRFPGYDQPMYSVFGNQDLLGGYLAFGLAIAFSLAANAPHATRKSLLITLGLAIPFLATVLLLSASRSAWLAAAAGVAGTILFGSRTPGTSSVSKKITNGPSGSLAPCFEEERVGLPLRRQGVRGPAVNRPDGKTRLGFWRSVCRGQRFSCIRPTLLLLTGLLLAILLALALQPALLQRALGTFGPNDIGGRARLWFWMAALRMICDHPLTGVGLGNFQYWSPWYQGEALRGPFGASLYRNELHTLHAHSTPLDLLAETGLIGMLVICWGLTRLSWRPSVWWGPFLAWITFSLLNSTLESMPHLLVGLIFFLFLTPGTSGSLAPGSEGERDGVRGGILQTLGTTDSVPDATHRPQWIHAFLTLLAVASLVLAHAYTVLLPSARLAAAEQAHLQNQDPWPRYQRALAGPLPNYPAAESAAVWCLEHHNPTQATALLQLARRGTDTGRIYYLLALAARQEGDQEQARHWIKECLFRWPDSAEAQELLQRLE